MANVRPRTRVVDKELCREKEDNNEGKEEKIVNGKDKKCNLIFSTDKIEFLL